MKALTEGRFKSDELIKTLEQNCVRLQTELDVSKRDLEERNYDLRKERLRIENLIRQEEVKINFRQTSAFSVRFFVELPIETQNTNEIL